MNLLNDRCRRNKALVACIKPESSGAGSVDEHPGKIAGLSRAHAGHFAGTVGDSGGAEQRRSVGHSAGAAVSDAAQRYASRPTEHVA